MRALFFIYASDREKKNWFFVGSELKFRMVIAKKKHFLPFNSVRESAAFCGVSNVNWTKIPVDNKFTNEKKTSAKA